MSGMASGALQATWYGHVATTRDALILFEACLGGTLHHVPRRPHDRERAQLIRSGCVFIYEENASGIKRWTDGVPWSPSRILGNFLIYRELVKPFPPGEKKRATKRTRRPTRPGEPYPRSHSHGDDGPRSPTTPAPRSDGGGEQRDGERALIGSLVDSYGFKEGGLVKKTMSVTVHGVHHHLVSYYKVADVLDGSLAATPKDARVAAIEPRVELIARQNFRAPLDDADDGMQDAGYGYDHAGSDRRPAATTAAMMLSGSGHAHHPPPMHLPLFGAMPYAANPNLQPGVHGYAIASQGFYPPPQPGAPKGEDYGGYGAGYHAGRGLDDPTSGRGPAPPDSAGAYAYRGHVPPMMPRPNGRTEASSAAAHDTKPDPSTWARSGGGPGPGAYAPTAPHASSNPMPYPGAPPWSVPASTGTLPQPENVWPTHDRPSWSMHHHVAGRAPAYHAAPPNH